MAYWERFSMFDLAVSWRFALTLLSFSQNSVLFPHLSKFCPIKRSRQFLYSTSKSNTNTEGPSSCFYWLNKGTRFDITWPLPLYPYTIKMYRKEPCSTNFMLKFLHKLMSVVQDVQFWFCSFWTLCYELCTPNKLFRKTTIIKVLWWGWNDYSVGYSSRCRKFHS